MKNLVQVFKSKYKANKLQSYSEKQEQKETQEQEILDNDCVIELNQEFTSKSKIIQKLAYSLQGKDYWEEKYL